MLEHINRTAAAPDRVVVVGAAGFVGGAICRNLERRGMEYLSVVRAQVDLLDVDAGADLRSLLRPGDALVAVAAVAPCKDLGMLQDNLRMVGSLADAIRNAELSHILNISSDAVYADSPSPLTEDACAGPSSIHGAMHLCRELVLEEAAGAVPFATLRPTLIYGADDPHSGYGPNRFRRLGVIGEPIELFGEGEERRDHVWVDDVAELAVLMLVHRSTGILNAATGTVVSFREIAEAIVGLCSGMVPIRSNPRNGPMPHDGYRPFDPVGTKNAFPEFKYTQPLDGFARVHHEVTGQANG